MVQCQRDDEGTPMCDAYHSPRANAHQPRTGAGIRALALPMALMMPIALSMPGAALADPSARSGNMGGGFIEFLMTGSAPTHRQGAPVQYAPRQHAPMRHAAHYAAPAPVSYGLEDEPLSQPQLAPRGDRLPPCIETMASLTSSSSVES